MNIENELKKDGITIIKPLDTLSVTLIAKYVAEKFMSFFPFSRIKTVDFFLFFHYFLFHILKNFSLDSNTLFHVLKVILLKFL